MLETRLVVRLDVLSLVSVLGHIGYGSVNSSRISLLDSDGTFQRVKTFAIGVWVLASGHVGSADALSCTADYYIGLQELVQDILVMRFPSIRRRKGHPHLKELTGPW